MTRKMNSLPFWRLWLPLGLQTVIVFSLVLPIFWIRWQGKLVVLRTVPVDPYDFLRGYSQTLRYDISSVQTIAALPKLQNWGEDRKFPDGTQFYLVLQAPTDRATDKPKPWQPVAVSKELPQNLAKNQAILQGTVKHGRIIYGLESFYFPEQRRTEINQAVNLTRRQQTGVAEVRTNDRGKAVLERLWIGENSYRF